jgi:hypothetical protein
MPELRGLVPAYANEKEDFGPFSFSPWFGFKTAYSFDSCLRSLIASRTALTEL